MARIATAFKEMLTRNRGQQAHPQRARSTALQDILSYEGIPFSACDQGQTIEVHGRLTLYNTTVPVMPRTLIVHGSLSLNGPMTVVMPEVLVVDQDLSLSSITTNRLPHVLSIGASVGLCHCRIPELPRGFRVNGSLAMQDSFIPSLPEGLDVDGQLLMWGSLIRVFPDDMRVGGTIYPYPTLRDLDSFMSGIGGDVVMTWTMPGHQKIQMRRDFPDLARILINMGPDQQLSIKRLRSGALDPEIQHLSR